MPASSADPRHGNFSDRYHHAQNLLVLTALVWTADVLVRSSGMRLKAN